MDKPFAEIVFYEYKSISSISVKSLYLTVCIMHRLGIATRAGLISRIHGIPFRMFKEELFEPLEFIVFAREDRIIGDFMYQSLYTENDFEGTRKIFSFLRGINLDVRIKREPHGIVNDNNQPVEYRGIIDTLEASYGFLLRDEFQDRIFTHKYHSKEHWDDLSSHRRVIFNLGFNYRGPIAINVLSTPPLSRWRDFIFQLYQQDKIHNYLI